VSGFRCRPRERGTRSGQASRRNKKTLALIASFGISDLWRSSIPFLWKPRSDIDLSSSLIFSIARSGSVRCSPLHQVFEILGALVERNYLSAQYWSDP
ncbi:unnamed protein product, partial [Musa textilis]